MLAFYPWPLILFTLRILKEIIALDGRFAIEIISKIAFFVFLFYRGKYNFCYLSES